MANKILRLLVATMLTGTLLVGCGSSETEVDSSTGTKTEVDSSTGTDTEADSGSDDTTTKTEVGVSNPDVTYNESEYCYLVSDSSFVDERFVDGSEMDYTSWEAVNTTINIKEAINIHNIFKGIMGYTKTDINVVYVAVNGEWSYIAFASEVAADGSYPNGSCYVRTDELKAVMVEVENTEDDSNGLSAEAEAYFKRLRDRIAEENVERAKVAEEHPNANIQQLVEVDSPEGMECFGPLGGEFDSDEDIENIMSFIYSYNCNKYYIEYLEETDEYVKFNFYGAK